MRGRSAGRATPGGAFEEAISRLDAAHDLVGHAMHAAESIVPHNLALDGPTEYVGPALTYLLFEAADQGSADDKADFLAVMAEKWPAGWKAEWFRPCCQRCCLLSGIGFLLHEVMRRDRMLAASDCAGEA